MKTRLVIYHAGCTDGFTAAWAAWKLFGDTDTEYKADRYDDQGPPDVTGRDVYVVDFSYPRDAMLRMYEMANTLHVFDHHKTAEEALKGLPFAKFDMNRSGAGLTWDELHPTNKRPWLVDYVEDKDLWRFALPNSRAVNAWIDVVGSSASFADWDKFLATPLEEVVKKGEVVVHCEDNFVDNMYFEARAVTLDGHRVPIVNSPRSHISQLLNVLAKEAPFAIGWHQRADGRFSYSLRSSPAVSTFRRSRRSTVAAGIATLRGFRSSRCCP